MFAAAAMAWVRRWFSDIAQISLLPMSSSEASTALAMTLAVRCGSSTRVGSMMTRSVKRVAASSRPRRSVMSPRRGSSLRTLTRGVTCSINSGLGRSWIWATRPSTVTMAQVMAPMSSMDITRKHLGGGPSLAANGGRVVVGTTAGATSSSGRAWAISSPHHCDHDGPHASERAAWPACGPRTWKRRPSKAWPWRNSPLPARP